MMRVFEGMRLRGFGAWWFRVFGYGISVVDHRKAGPFFSERYSGMYGVPKRCYLHVGLWCVRFLRRRS